MNFLRDRKLARRLKNNEVSSKEQFIYLLLVHLIIGLFMTSTLTHNEYPLNAYNRTVQIIIPSVVIGFIGIALDNMAVFTDARLATEGMTAEETKAISENIQIGIFTLIGSTMIFIYVLWRSYTAMLIASGAKE